LREIGKNAGLPATMDCLYELRLFRRILSAWLDSILLAGK
jgi:hypothetical protein